MKSKTLALSLAVCFLTCCTKNKRGGYQKNKGNTAEQTWQQTNNVVIANLPDSLQPRSRNLSTFAPSKNLLQQPRTKSLPLLINERGEVVKGKDGNPFILGDGGKAFFTTFNTDQGLALDGVYCSLLDKTGALWFGTLGGGASRYDGKTFTNFTTNQGLVHNSIMGIVEDNTGNIWFGTAGGGISKYDGKTFTNFTKSDGLPSNEIWSVAKDKKGCLWFGTRYNGVSCFNGKSFIKYDTTQGLANNEVLGIKEDSKGNLWFATLGGGVSCYNGTTFKNFNKENGLSDNTVFNITEDKFGNLWFATRRGASLFDGNVFRTFTMSDGLSNNAVMCVKAIQNGDVWFGTNGGGISRYDGKSFYNYTIGQGLSNNNVFSIEEDRTGNLWFGTYGGGVCRFSDNSFTSFTTAEGLASNKVFAIAEDKAGQLWFGTNGGGICRFDKESFTTYSIDQGLPNNAISCLLEDRNGKLWIGTNGSGVSCYDGKSFTTFSVIEGLPNNTVLCSAEDRKGNLWIGTEQGVSRFDGKSFTNFSSAQGLADNIINSIAEDSKGNLWFGTNGGLSCYNGISISTFTSVNEPRRNKISCITVDKAGQLWLGSFGGVSRFDGKTFTNFTTTEGLADNTVNDIIQDKSENIIIATNLGFTVIPAIANSRPFSEIKNDLEYFNNPNGYPIKDANGSNALFCDKDGMIWVGTGSEKTALVRFNYNALKKVNTTPVLQINAIKINEENILWSNLAHQNATTDSAYKKVMITEELNTFGKLLSEEERETMRRRYSKVRFDSITPFYPIPINLVLPYKHNKISFEFNAIETDRPQFVNYQYMLEGYDNEWSPVLRKTSASFGNISEGRYLFKVKAQGNNGNWSEPLSYSFKVLPPLHRTLWAYFLYIIISVLLLWRILVFLKSRAIRLEREKASERELVHAKEIEKAYEKLQATQSLLIHSEKMASLVVLTAGIAHEIQNPLNFVNNFSQINEELLDELKKGPLAMLNGEEKKQTEEIINNLALNMQKISLHGSRADSIVKGMLQHSRSGKMDKVVTDINRLADEYLRTSYHGLRDKDNTFNAIIKTDFDERVGSISVIPQDIGRVILNLINNAFYAVYEKSKLKTIDFVPTITVSTQRIKQTMNTRVKGVQITVTDNGSGISPAIIDKIFQPFFSTKPTGQGTGLGLSLSYDIVKAHGGTLEVETKEGEGSSFIIQLPDNI